VPRKGQWLLTGLILISYWFCLTHVTVPGYGAGILTRAGNWGAWLDRLVIPTAHLYSYDDYQGLGDPGWVAS
jgi:predicted acyltransferase